MTIVSIKSGSDEELRKIELSDGSFFSFKACYLPPVFLNENLYTPGLANGCEISAAEEEAFRFASACLRAEKAALQLIAHAEQNTFGLSRKLKKRGHGAACVNAAISRLAELELVDDRRYAGLWLESHISRQASSPRRLLAALQSRGIDYDDAETALKNVLDDETEQQLLERYIQKQRRKGRCPSETTSGDDDSAARRSLRYLLKSEGFSGPAIQRFFND